LLGATGETVSLDQLRDVSSTLIESELFGCTRGMFARASGDKEGALRATDGGALLFEIGELPLVPQPRPRTHPTRPALPGSPVRVEHEYEGRGARNLFAAFDPRSALWVATNVLLPLGSGSFGLLCVVVVVVASGA
jgi:hypothetical protein